MSAIERHGSGGPFERRVGYSRVVRAGGLVAVSGCTAIRPDGSVAGEDAGTQAAAAIEAVLAALAQAGAGAANVIRTRIYLTDIGQWPAVGDAHARAFGAAPPAATAVQVAALIDPRLLVEIEATAWVGG